MQVTLDVERLRSEIQDKYAIVALTPEKGFHFHTGYSLTEMLEYPQDDHQASPGVGCGVVRGGGQPLGLLIPLDLTTLSC